MDTKSVQYLAEVYIPLSSPKYYVSCIMQHAVQWVGLFLVTKQVNH